MEKIWKGLLLIFLIPVIVWAAADPSAFIYAPKGWEIQSSCTGIKDNGSGCWNGSTLCIGNGTSCVGVSASSISSYLDITKWFSSGTCSGYLKSDGTCDAGGITPGLNIDPTGNVSVGANGKISVGVGGNFSIGAGSTLKIEPNLPAIVDITLNLQQIFQGLGSVGPNAVGCFNSSGLPVACTNLTDIAIPTGTMASQGANAVAITGGTINGINYTSLSVSGKVDWGMAPDIASATTTNIGAANGVAMNVTGTNTISGFDNVPAGITRLIKFTNALTLVYNATSLILPGASNILTANGDRATFVSLGGGNWYAHEYLKGSGIAIGRTNPSLVTANTTLTRDQMFGGLLNNYGQNVDTTATMLALEDKMNFIVALGTTVAKFFKLKPAGSDVIILDGTALTGGQNVVTTSAAAGAQIQCYTIQTGASAYQLLCNSISGSWTAL